MTQFLPEYGGQITDQRHVCSFPAVFESSNEPGDRMDFISYFNELPWFFMIELECCKRPVTAFEMQEARASCTRGKSPCLESLSYKLHSYMLKFSNLLSNVYCNRQQNGRIPSFGSQRVVALLRNDPSKENCIDNFRHITLLNAEFKILAKVLAIRLSLVVVDLIGAAQTCAIPKLSIHNNLHR